VGCGEVIEFYMDTLRFMTVLFQNLSEQEADAYRLVLSSAGIFFRLKQEEHGWCLSVKDSDVENAAKEIKQYLAENQKFTASSKMYRDSEQRSFAGLWVSIVLLVCHVAVAVTHSREVLVHSYGSSASHILRGQLYRSVTALMLHADAMHILANTVGMAVFGTAVCMVMGWGAGVMGILITGAIGNLLNALLYGYGHISIGASTAIFGSIGILSGYQFFNKIRQPDQKLKAFLPISGGFALLAILGSGAHSDVMAHLFGFLAGLVLGSLYALLVKRKVFIKYQVFFLITAMVIVAAAWLKAF
jgi:membrane associated rhomboid family serine protease